MGLRGVSALLFSICLAGFAAAEKTVDEIVAPNSYAAAIRGWWRNDPLHGRAKSFDVMSPELIIRGVDVTAPPTIVLWKDMGEAFKNGAFDSFIQEKLADVVGDASKLVMVVHGYLEVASSINCVESWPANMARKIGEYENGGNGVGTEPTVSIGICWNSSPIPPTSVGTGYSMAGAMCTGGWTTGLYYPEACSTGKMGEFIATVVKSMKTVFPTIKYVHGIGHSLGAHIMGNIYNFGDLKIDRISGLDPAGPCFEQNTWMNRGNIEIVGKKWGVTKDSASFVDNIHTDGDHYGTYESKGHLDIFTGDPNYDASGAGAQPTCMMCVTSCCHNLSHRYYLDSINSTEYTRYKTAYSMLEDFSVGTLDPSSAVYAGYHANRLHAQPRSALGAAVEKRMFLPMFDVNGTWTPVCGKRVSKTENGQWCQKQSALFV